MRRSRWKKEIRTLPDGSEEAFRLRETDLDYFKLLCDAPIRQPWGYQYLPSSYIAALLDRHPNSTNARLRQLSDRDFIRKPDQGRNNFRQLIYSLAPRGADEIRFEGHNVPTLRLNAIPHELFCCLIAASFDFASKDISLIEPIEKLHPDWPPFNFSGRQVFIEADIGRMQVRKPKKGDSNSIEEKFERYLTYGAELDNPFFLFVTTLPERINTMKQVLDDVIKRTHSNKRAANYFGFTAIRYNRFIDTIPPLTDWAAKEVSGENRKAA